MLQDNVFLVGKLKSSRMPYYDNKAGLIKFKARPVLILKAEKEFGQSDFTVLPVSSVSFKKNVDLRFDVEVTKTAYPLLNLTKEVCYIRCGKIMTINKSDLATEAICDLKEVYPELWEQIVGKTKEYVFDIH